LPFPTANFHRSNSQVDAHSVLIVAGRAGGNKVKKHIDQIRQGWLGTAPIAFALIRM